jgi:predicted nucleic acid-binding protein
MLLERVESGDVSGIISANVLHDVAHRLMTLEACSVFSWPYAGIGQRLRRSPEQIKLLQRFQSAVAEILAIGVGVLPVESANVVMACDVSRTYGLLSGDALIVALMQAHGINVIASNDADFDRVPTVARYSPV